MCEENPEISPEEDAEDRRSIAEYRAEQAAGVPTIPYEQVRAALMSLEDHDNNSDHEDCG